MDADAGLLKGTGSIGGREIPQQKLYWHYLAALQESDRRRAQRLLREAIMSGFRESELLQEVVSPAVEAMASTWIEHELSLSQIYVAGLIVRDSVETLSPVPKPGEKAIGRVVIGTVHGDHHGLGKLIVAAFLRSAGFAVTDLGLSVRSESFVETALAEQASIIAVSALMADAVQRIPGVREEMVRRGANHLRLLVGGAPFRRDHELFRRVGADACAANAYEAIRVAKGLVEIGGYAYAV
ncbi:MAG: cobalamin B12-binding domain-containing protein [Chloroflexi bacterium]|nr:cobalamin B12-binding domain-containing protein [Chloroflexota bacterium]